MKKIIKIIFFSLIFFINVNANEREIELNNLFKKLKSSKSTESIEIEKKINEIWLLHPINDRKGFRLTELLNQGSFFINSGELNKAYEIFTQIIVADPSWAEAWNKRAYVLYLMNRYHSSLDDVNIAITLEPRHFGALAGKGRIQIELKDYEKAIISYKEAQKIYPTMQAPEDMISYLKDLIDGQSL